MGEISLTPPPISIVTGLSRSELLREGLRNIILHYSVEESFNGNDQETNVPELLKQILGKLERGE